MKLSIGGDVTLPHGTVGNTYRLVEMSDFPNL
jgi:hypothetical protein